MSAQVGRKQHRRGSPDAAGLGNHCAPANVLAQADGHLRGARTTHDLVKWLDRLASRHSYQLVYSVVWALTEQERTAIALVPAAASEAAINADGTVRERRA